MLYSIVGHDFPDSLDKRMAARPAHVARLQQLRAEGRLILAGPNPAIDSSEPGDAGFSGSLIVAEFDCLDQAKEWANDDPYVKQNVYQTVEVKPFNKVLP